MTLDTESIRNLIREMEFPIGPQVASFLQLGFDEGLKQTEQSESRADEFKSLFSSYLSQNPLQDRTKLIQVMEELVAMRLGDLAIAAHNQNPELGVQEDFRGLLTLGNSAMLEGDLDSAKSWLSSAQSMAPEESAPYVNLANIYFHEQQDEQAEKWALAGIEADKNNRRLWEVLGLIFQARFGNMAGDQLQSFASQKNSWAGLSLSALLIDADDAQLRAELLGDIYSQGLREHEFLIEYTAVLGTAGQFRKIPLILFQLEKVSKDPIPWQLYIHAAQSLMAVENWDDARKACMKVLKLEGLKESIHTHTKELIAEIDLSLEKNKKIDAFKETKH